MADIQLQLNDKGQGAFYISENGERFGEMAISVNDTHLTVYHTEISPKMEGKGFAKQLLDNMVKYAAANNLKVIPLCPYVHAQFKRHEQEYASIWEKAV
jgi:predicted GNAT family acetyltransferase